MKKKITFLNYIAELVEYRRVFAAFSLPDDKKVTLIVQNDHLSHPFTSKCIEGKKGFALQNFSWDKGGSFILADNEYSVEKVFDDIVVDSMEIKQPFLSQVPKAIFSITKEAYVRKIEKLKADIAHGDLKKAVFSRTLKEQIEPSVLADVFSLLVDSHSKSFVYMINSPVAGMWFGATPETLLRADRDYYYTMALAGTRKIGETNIWGSKEVDEQAIVSEFIESHFNELGKPLIKEGPFSLAAGESIEHLCTKFKAGRDKNMDWQVINALHPTPAVCGQPLQKAREFILENEAYDRGLYTGFIGPVYSNGDFNFFVNLRCAQVIDKKAYLYVGGGITSDSNAEHEWEETILKSQTLLNPIRQQTALLS
ncbi:MAG: chorismate-binding protein [Vicingaceae bacterium]